MASQRTPNKVRRHNRFYWVVSLGKKHTGGLRQRRYFSTRKEAKIFVTQSEQARRALGQEAFLIPLSLRAEALVCSQRLKSFNVSLSQAVEFFVQKHSVPETAKPIKMLCEEFLKSRRAMNCRQRTLIQYESYFRIIGNDFASTDVKKVHRHDIEDWLEEADWSPRTRKNYLVTITTLLNYAVNKGYRTDNPASSIERPILDDKPPGILNIAQVRELLRVVKSSAPEMLPALAIGLFSGLRRSEFFALDWEEIDWEQRTIEVKGIKAKTRQRRLVYISNNLFEWIIPYRKIRGAIVVERNIDQFSERMRELALQANITPWPHNALRHSFGSYFLGRTKDEHLTASEMGNSPEVVIKHYRALVRDADVKEFWGLTPTTVSIGGPDIKIKTPGLSPS